MQSYGVPGRDTGVVAYEIGADYIKVRFVDGTDYVYDSRVPGDVHVARMKALAVAGTGLSTYISQHVRDAYARKEKNGVVS